MFHTLKHKIHSFHQQKEFTPRFILSQAVFHQKRSKVSSKEPSIVLKNFNAADGPSKDHQAEEGRHRRGDDGASVLPSNGWTPARGVDNPTFSADDETASSQVRGNGDWFHWVSNISFKYEFQIFQIYYLYSNIREYQNILFLLMP